jgi:hypothetical protein
MSNQNGAKKEIEPTMVLNNTNGGYDGNACIPVELPKMGLDSQTEIREEAVILRRVAAELALNAGISLTQKEEYGAKEFDSYIGTWAKIAGVQAKLDGGGDGVEQLMSELADGDGSPDES